MSAPASAPSRAQREIAASILINDAPAAVSSNPSAPTRAGELHPATAQAMITRKLATYGARVYGDHTATLVLTEHGEAVAVAHIAKTLTEAQVQALRLAEEAHGNGRGVIHGIRTRGHGLVTGSTVKSLVSRRLVSADGAEFRITQLGHEVYLHLDAPRVERVARETAERERREREQASDRAAVIETYDPELTDAASFEAPQEISGRDAEPRYTERERGITDAVRAHIELAARLDELEGQLNGTSNRTAMVVAHSKAEELERTMAMLVDLGVIEEPVPLSDEQVGALAMAHRSRHKDPAEGVRLGETWTLGRYDDPTRVEIEMTADILVTCWRRALLAYVGGGEFVLTERGERGYAQARKAGRDR